MNRFKSTPLFLFLSLCFLCASNCLAQNNKEEESKSNSIDEKYHILENYESYKDLELFINSLHIEKIYMTYDGGNGNITIGDEFRYTIAISKNGEVSLIGEGNLELTGKYHSSINKKTYGKLTYLIERMDFNSLPKELGRPTLHSDWHNFEIRYKDSTKKEVRDYDSSGPISLWSFEKVIDNFRFTLDWEKQN